MTSLTSEQERKELHCFCSDELLQFIPDEGTPMQYKDIISPAATIINSTPMLLELMEEELDFFFVKLYKKSGETLTMEVTLFILALPN